MAHLAATITRARSLEELVRPLLEMLQATTGLESTYLTTIDSPAGVQHILFARNTHQMQIPEGLDVPWEGTLCKRALDDGRFYSDDVSQSWGDCEAARALGIATYASSPVHTEGGVLYGTLCAASSQHVPFNDNTESVLKLFAQLIGQQLDRERLVQQLSDANNSLAASALTDTVTRLPNRRALMQDMEQRLRLYRADEYALVVAFIDLDKFKAINDRYGHEIGDRFLEAIAGRLQGVLRSGDFAARLGGDEFVVLATSRRSDALTTASALLERLQQATSGRFRLDDTVLDYAGPSIGTVISEPDCTDPQALIAAADARMYAVKRARKEREAQRLSN
ncbi:sensor domain-containing diguanylate cyclase [Dyella mobilis]|nr:sensor domain-containing diguanylate cyclase [Dyella mobilis]GLQ95757.1 GGDEF domain-containing protein [Dyella mobilis]